MEKVKVGSYLSVHERCNQLIPHLSSTVGYVNNRQSDSSPVQGMDVGAGSIAVTRRIKNIAVVSEVEIVPGLQLRRCAHAYWRMLRDDLTYPLQHLLCCQRLQALEVILAIAP